MKSYTNVDEYIASVPEQSKAFLKTLRQTIRELVPEAAEKISYGIPTFTLNDKYFIYIAGYDKHVSLYPIPPGDKEFERDLAPYVAGKGTVHFSLDKPLPLDLICRMIRFAVKARENRATY